MRHDRQRGAQPRRFPDAAVELRELSRSFGDIQAVESLSLEVQQGEIFGLVGPDGAGKTTTLRMLASILDPTAGDAWILGHHVVDDATAIHDSIGYMSQRFGLYPDLTVLENLNFYADLYGVSRRDRQERIDRLLGFSNMQPFGRRQAGKLSGGMKQKLGLSCALIHSPKLLLLDEPTNGVDPVSRRDFWRILYQLLADGVTIVVSTAYLDEAERCSRVALLHEGKLVASDTPRDLRRLVEGELLEVRASDTRAAAALLREAPAGESVILFGDRVHVFTRDTAASSAVIERELARAGVDLHNIRTIEPTLESVFVSLLGSAPAEEPQ
jgi:ABC-2 type transport system ATP-binding protein